MREEETTKDGSTSRTLRKTEAGIAGMLPAAAMAFPATALAESNAKMLPKILDLVEGAVSMLGAFLIVWGGVSLGMAIREQSGGPQIASAIATIAGGAVIIAAAVYFGTVDTSWFNSAVK